LERIEPGLAHYTVQPQCLFGPKATRPYQATAVETDPSPRLLSLHACAPVIASARPWPLPAPKVFHALTTCRDLIPQGVEEKGQFFFSSRCSPPLSLCSSPALLCATHHSPSAGAAPRVELLHQELGPKPPDDVHSSATRPHSYQWPPLTMKPAHFHCHELRVDPTQLPNSLVTVSDHRSRQPPSLLSARLASSWRDMPVSLQSPVTSQITSLPYQCALVAPPPPCRYRQLQARIGQSSPPERHGVRPP
jgi:hypothetical protein